MTQPRVKRRLTFTDTLFFLFLALLIVLGGCAPAPEPGSRDMQRLLRYMADGCKNGVVLVDDGGTTLKGKAYEWTCASGYRDRTLYPYEFWIAQLGPAHQSNGTGI